MSVEVTISFKRIGSSEWSRVGIPAGDYFDQEWNEGETLGVDSVPRYDDAIQYLEGMSEGDVDATQIEVEDRLLGKRRVVAVVYWNRGTNSTAEISEFEGLTMTYWELIFDTLVSRNPRIYEVLRVGRSSGLITVLSHCFIEARPDGTERQFDEYVTFDDKSSAGRFGEGSGNATPDSE
jgi:hypothetical protein